MARVFYDKDADLSALSGKTVAVLGYGSQGRAQALNLRDSGVKVLVGVREGGRGYARATEDGFRPVSCADAARGADVVQMLLPDPVAPAVYYADVHATLSRGKTLMFSHGFNVHYNQIVPPEDVDCVMIAPKGPGALVRSMYTSGAGVPALLAVSRDATGRARDTALAYAKGIGATRAGVIETTFKEETETDLFGEQAVLCGGTAELIKAGFETLVEAGYQPEVAYFECLAELKLIVDLIYEGGISGMRRGVSETARFGDVVCGPRVIDGHVRQTMKALLAEVQDGRFAREWILENKSGRPVYSALLARDEDHQIERVGRRLREMMPWIAKGKGEAR